MARSLKTASPSPGGALSLEGGFIKSKSAAEDVLTIQGSSAQTGDLFNVGVYTGNSTADASEVINVTSSGETRIGKIQSVVCSTDTMAYTVLSSNSGKRHIVPGYSSEATITLPAADAGLNYSFWLKEAGASNAVIFGFASSPGVLCYGALIDAVTVTAATSADWIGGTRLDFWCNGDNWFMAYKPPGGEASALITVSASD